MPSFCGGGPVVIGRNINVECKSVPSSQKESSSMPSALRTITVEHVNCGATEMVNVVEILVWLAIAISVIGAIACLVLLLLLVLGVLLEDDGQW